MVHLAKRFRFRSVHAAGPLAALIALASAAADPPNPSPESSMEEPCRQEVLELHQFFQDWYNAVLEPTDESFARLADVIDADFVLISPNGRITERPALLEQLRGNHGNWQDLKPSEETGGSDLRPRIRIENFKLRRLTGDAALATYEEWHEVGGKSRGRLSTVLFGRHEGTANGVVWLHLHEVWLPAP